MLRVKVVLSVLCWEMLKVAQLFVLYAVATSFRDLNEHTCCVWHFDTVMNEQLFAACPALRPLEPRLSCFCRLLRRPGRLRFDD